jgi:hypothetical protein
MSATAQDAEVILRLYELRREPVLRQAREWFAREFGAAGFAEFERQCPPGSDANRYFRMVTSYWDMAAAIVLQGAVHEALFFETNGEFMLVWNKVAAWIGEFRAARGHPRFLRNLEQLVARRERYLAAQAKEA